ncbi:PREDICTED: GPI ethanolamine phosphate transferase 1 isoform X1 [Ipomoea nil]|uniref:GPI ethanolamine phosphate transferase 1 isoform X1 n=1 Tax=Ipomoea nil TaxID=35883 RepID=UPI0009013A37|nr:PREDICTED: GPI ethanolamine phosphate transferase 1 isoform X1 [Ipomoea nil]
MRGDGILGVEGVQGKRSERSIVTERKKWLKRREKWLVVVGIVLHAVYMLSIFDIYFKTPIVHGMDPVTPRYSAPAKRLVLLIADGLRADKFFEPDSEGNYRAPFLRSVIKEQGRWGVSHARPPTESRPGHVAIIAGFYEDPSAVTKGWKANPVEFDSVFNRSRHTFAFGSPDIIPIFCGALPHSTWNSYPHDYEDFATDASFLDEWSLDQFQSLLNRSNKDPELKQLLQQDKLTIFLHLLGCDSNGHAHRPYSSIYLNNVKVVDSIAERVYNLIQSYFKDNSTAYIFTADHGMSDKGSHGDGHPSNTDTPLVAWGAGIGHPMLDSHNNHPDKSVRFVDEHLHDTPTPSEWGLNGISRMDVNQADIAPLMSTLLGLSCPINSVGNLPLDYIKLNEGDEVEAVLANTKQILNQFLRKSELKQLHSLYFKPFKPLSNHSLVLGEIEYLISVRDYKAAMKLLEDLRSLALSGLNYFQTYDWLMLMTVITLGYIGWMVYIVLHVLESYTSLPENFFRKEQFFGSRKSSPKAYLCGGLLMGVVCVLLLYERSPPLYHAYIAMTIFLWTQIFSEYKFLTALWRYLGGRKCSYFLKLIATCIFSILILELLVISFTERKIYTWCFITLGATSSIYLFKLMPQRSGIPIFLWLACWLLSVFTLMPPEIPENTPLVITGGLMIILIGGVAQYLELHAKDNKYWHGLLAHDLRKLRFPLLFHLQIILVGLSSLMVWLSTSHRIEKQELHGFHQLMNWSIAGFAMVLPLFSASGLLSRLTSIFIGFAPPFLLLSIGYEALFYGALGLVLIGWIFFENANLYISKGKLSTNAIDAVEDGILLSEYDRCLQLSDIRIPLIFMVLFNVAFFGTGNFASIASFEISSVYRFITVFSPFLMAALLIFKLLIPFILVICAFSAMTKLIRVPLVGCYFLVIMCSDVMTIHFFFLVRNTGSWMEIGNTISHFGIMSAQVVFVLLLFALTNIYTKDIKITRTLQKEM